MGSIKKKRRKKMSKHKYDKRMKAQRQPVAACKSPHLRWSQGAYGAQTRRCQRHEGTEVGFLRVFVACFSP